MQLLLENKVRIHGRTLVTLASLGAAIVVSYGLVMAACAWLPASAASFWHGLPGMEWTSLVAPSGAQRLQLSLAALLWTGALLAPLPALRRLGKRLQRHNLLSRPVTRAFAWLAHSLPLYAALAAISAVLRQVAMSELASGQAITLDLTQFYLLLVTGVCLYTVAHLMRLAADVAEDARSIV